MKHILTILALLLPLALAAQEEYVDPVFGDNIDRTADDFVTVSLCVAEPGGVLYSRLGHVALHMQCPTFNLDYVYSYESEDVRNRVLSFLSGKLKMGMMAIPPQDYLSGYEADGRGVREYGLNLPVEVKRELWRVLDERLEQGIDLPYDYLQRGCAHSTLMSIKEALDGYRIEYGAWPECFEGCSRREVTAYHMRQDRWTLFLLQALGGGSIDKYPCPKEQKVIIPEDLVYVLSHATIEGRTVISSAPEQVLPSVTTLAPSRFSPVYVALLILLLTIALGLFGTHLMEYVLLGIQTAIGIFETYLVFFSTLCCTEWNWLLVVFNPLPLIFWRWRKYWRIPYAAVIVIWAAFMLLSPHMLTDFTYIILALAVAAGHLLAARRV